MSEIQFIFSSNNHVETKGREKKTFSWSLNMPEWGRKCFDEGREFESRNFESGNVWEIKLFLSVLLTERCHFISVSFFFCLQIELQKIEDRNIIIKKRKKENVILRYYWQDCDRNQKAKSWNIILRKFYKRTKLNYLFNNFWKNK